LGRVSRYDCSIGRCEQLGICANRCSDTTCDANLFQELVGSKHSERLLVVGAMIPAKCAPSLKATLLFKSEERMYVIAALRDHFEPDSGKQREERAVRQRS